MDKKSDEMTHNTPVSDTLFLFKAGGYWNYDVGEGVVQTGWADTLPTDLIVHSVLAWFPNYDIYLSKRGGYSSAQQE